MNDSLLRSLLDAFQLPYPVASFETWRAGHINATYCATLRQPEGDRRYVVQKVNSHVFKEIQGLMDNAFRVSKHIVGRLAAETGKTAEEVSKTVVRYLSTTDGGSFVKDSESTDVWRIYPCVEDAFSVLVAESPEQAREAGRVFGEFQRLIQDLPGPRLVETIPDFHNTPKRFARLAEVAAADPLGRRAAVEDTLQAILALASRGATLQEAFARGEFPERIVHNDCKMSNALFSTVTGKGLCAIDLDTVMPGYAIHDFGDLMRTACNPLDEDTEDLEHIRVDFDAFEAIVSGYLSEAVSFLTPAEIRLLPEAGWAMTMENAVRFLTDHLEGDVYFHIARPGHNLVRAKAQLVFAQRVAEAMPRLNDIVAKLAPKA